MDNTNGKEPAEGSKPATRIQWDEVTIAEHDKERGSRYSLPFLRIHFHTTRYSELFSPIH